MFHVPFNRNIRDLLSGRDGGAGKPIIEYIKTGWLVKIPNIPGLQEIFNKPSCLLFFIL